MLTGEEAEKLSHLAQNIGRITESFDAYPLGYDVYFDCHDQLAAKFIDETLALLIEHDALLAKAEVEGTCQWTPDGPDCWHTACGRHTAWLDGGKLPRYCHECGGRVVENGATA